MKMTDYQMEAKATAVFPPEHSIPYLALGLSGEAGEIANKVKKVLRGDFKLEDMHVTLAQELGDVLWYLAMLAEKLGYGLDEIAHMNLEKLADRRMKNKLLGEGDTR